jgi:sarcosine oxidase subunit alpha
VRRLPAGGRVDRGAPLRFSFGGLQHQGLEGDTLASALLCNGLGGAFRSPVLGRPRGVMTAGPEEPCAFVEVSAPWFDLIAPATMVPLVEGLAATPSAGVARLPGPEVPAPPSQHRHAHVETLVIGGGVAGLRAAREAAARGDRVLLVDERSWLGGTARSFEIVEGLPAWEWVDAVAAELRAAAEVTLLEDAAALGVYDGGYVVVHQRSRPVQRLWHVRAKRVVLAAGAHERPIAFAGNDRPGVMLSGAVLTYLDRFGVLPAERAVVFTTSDAGYAAARALREAGARVVAIVDVRLQADARDRARADGFQVMAGAVIAATEGAAHVSAAIAIGPDGARTRLEAELIAVSGGWNPVTQLHRAIGGGLRYATDRSCFVPEGGPGWLSVVGAAAGEVPAAEACWYVPADDLSRHRGRPGGSPLRSSTNSWARERERRARATHARHGRRSPTTCSPAPSGTRCSTPSAGRRSTRRTSSEGQCSRTSGSGSARGTSRATASRCGTRCCASARPCGPGSG